MPGHPKTACCGFRLALPESNRSNIEVEGVFYVNDALEKLMFEELRNACRGGGVGGFLPAMKQIGNVAALPGIVHVSQSSEL
ncbi:hypothetical protein H8958_007818 [Nasalis larvatus]